MKKIKISVIALLVFSLITTSCVTTSVEASASSPSNEGLSDYDIAWLFPAEDNLLNVVDWNQVWKPELPRAPSQGELMDAYYDWASQNGLILVPEVPITKIQGEELTLIPAVYEDGSLALVSGVGTQAIRYSLKRFTLNGLKIVPFIPSIPAKAILVGVVIVAGVVFFVYVYAKTHTDVSHDPYSGVGPTRIRTIMSNQNDPGNKCFKMVMNYQKNGKQVIRFGIAQKIAGANHGNYWLFAIAEGSKWITVYPVEGDLTKTSALTEFVELIACSLVTFPPVP